MICPICRSEMKAGEAKLRLGLAYSVGEDFYCNKCVGDVNKKFLLSLGLVIIAVLIAFALMIFFVSH